MDKIITGSELRTARVALGLTREAVGDATDLSASTIKNLELGQVRGKPYAASPEISAALVAFFRREGLHFLPPSKGRIFGLEVTDQASI